MKVGKKTKIGLCVLGGLLAIFVLAHTPPIKGAARWGLAHVISRASAAPVSIEQLDYRLWRGELELLGLSVGVASEASPFRLEVERIHGRISPTVKFSGEVERLDLIMVNLPESTAELGSAAPAGVPSVVSPEGSAESPIAGILQLLGYVRALHITESTIRFSDTNGAGDLEEWIWIAGITADVIETDGSHRIGIHSEGGELRFEAAESAPRAPFALGALDADLALSTEALRVHSASLLLGDSFVRADGALDLAAAATGTFDIQYALDGSLARLIDDELALTGVATGEAQARIDAGVPTVDAAFRSEAVQWNDITVSDVQAAANYSEGTLRIERASAAGFGGEAQISGELELREAGEQQIEVTWSGIDVADAVRQIGAGTLPLAARVSGDAQLQWTGWRFENASGDARIRLDPGADLEGNLRAELGRGIVRLETDRVELVPWSTTLSARADLDIAGGSSGFDHELVADYEIRAADITRFLKLVPDFPVTTSGAISAVGRVDGSLESPHWTAQLASEALTLAGDPLALSGSLEGSTESVIVHEARLEGGRGALVASGTAPLSATQTWALTASIEDFVLGLKALPLESTINGTMEITGEAADPDWTTELQLLPLSAFGVEGRASLMADKRGREIHIGQIDADYAGGNFSGTGRYALDSRSVEGSFHLTGLRLSELPLPGEYTSGLEGIVQLEATLAGTVENPEGSARLALTELTHNDDPMPGVALGLEALEGQVLIEGTREGGEALLTGQLQLEGDYPLHAEIDLASLPVTEWMHSIEVFLDREQASWTVEGLAEIDVNLAIPETVIYGAEVRSIETRFLDRTIRMSPFKISGNADGLNIDGFEMVGERLRLALDGSLPFSNDEVMDVVSQGTLDLAVLALLDPELTMQGRADLNLTLGGSYDDPRADGELFVRDGLGSYGDLEWKSLNLTLQADNDRLRNLVLTAETLDGTVSVGGELSLRSDAPGGFLDLDVQEIDLAGLLPPEHRSSGLSMVTSISGRLEVPRLDLESLSGTGVIGSFSIGAGDVAVEAVRDAPWRIDGGELSISALRLEGVGGELEVRLDSLRLVNGMDLRAAANGRLDAEILSPLLAAYGLRVRGEATLDLGVEVTDGDLSLNGGGSIRGGRFSSLQPPFTLTDTNVDFVLSEKMLEITQLEARSGSGRLQGGGNLDWSDLESPVVDLRLNAKAVQVEIMGGFRSQISGELRLSNPRGVPTLSGDILLDRGQMTREFDDGSDAFSSQSFALRDPTIEQSALSQLNLDLVVRTGRNIHIDNSTARLEVAGSISVSGTVTAPELGGVMTVMPDGTLTLANRSIQIITGRVDLTGFPLERPFLDVRAVSRVGTTVINIRLEGNTNDIRTTLTAPESPELTEGDLASLLVTGRTLEHAGEGGQQIAATWMMSSLAGLVHEGLGNLITFGPPPGAGPLILSEEADPTSRLSFGVPVTERLSITYSMALDSTERRLWILDYRVARNFWIRAIQENANDYAFGISQRLTFDVRSRPTPSGVPRRRDQYITSVSIEGLPPEPEQRLRVQQGNRYEYWDVRDEAARLRQNLIDAGHLSAVVEVETEVEEGEVQDAVLVRFVVSAGARSTIVWRGEDPGRSIRNDIKGRWDGRIPEEFLLVDLVRIVRTRLQSERYFEAAVAASVEEEEDADGTVRSIVFDVSQGPRGEAVVLAFEGNAILSNEELSAALPGTRTPEFFVLLGRPSELERGIRLRYAAEGHLDATSGTPETRFDSATGNFHVDIPVDEGPLVRVTAVDFGEGLSIDSARLDESFGMVAGTRVDFPAIQEGQTRLRTLYRSEGFSEVRVRASLDRTVEGVNVALLIEEGTRARVGEIRVVGNSRTNSRVIRNEVMFQSGDPIRITDFQRTQKRLYDLGVFRSADVRTEPSHQGREVQDIVIQVVERADVDLSYGLRYNFIQSEQSISLESEPRSTGLEATARVNFINPFRRGTTLGFSIFYQKNHQLFRTTLRMPTFFRRHITTEFIVDTENETYTVGEDYPSLESRGSGVTFQQTKKLTDSRTDKLSLQWNFRYGKFRADRFDDEGERELIDTYRPRFGISLIEDRRDSFANPTRGRFWNVTFQGVPEIWGSDVGYVRVYGQLFLYFPLFKSVVWASGFRAGVSSGTQEILLMEDRFQAGGANSVRGYKQNTLGPAVFFLVPDGEQNRLYLGGQAVTVINQELRFPIWNILHGGVYWDAGNVWATTKDFSLGDLKHTVGVGARVVLPFGALRFDYAEPLNPCSAEQLAQVPISPCAADTVRFHFSFGYAF